MIAEREIDAAIDLLSFPWQAAATWACITLGKAHAILFTCQLRDVERLRWNFNYSEGWKDCYILRQTFSSYCTTSLWRLNRSSYERDGWELEQWQCSWNTRNALPPPRYVDGLLSGQQAVGTVKRSHACQRLGRIFSPVKAQHCRCRAANKTP